MQPDTFLLYRKVALEKLPEGSPPQAGYPALPDIFLMLAESFSGADICALFRVSLEKLPVCAIIRQCKIQTGIFTGL